MRALFEFVKSYLANPKAQLDTELSELDKSVMSQLDAFPRPARTHARHQAKTQAYRACKISLTQYKALLVQHQNLFEEGEFATLTLRHESLELDIEKLLKTTGKLPRQAAAAVEAAAVAAAVEAEAAAALALAAAEAAAALALAAAVEAAAVASRTEGLSVFNQIALEIKTIRQNTPESQRTILSNLATELDAAKLIYISRGDAAVFRTACMAAISKAELACETDPGFWNQSVKPLLNRMIDFVNSITPISFGRMGLFKSEAETVLEQKKAALLAQPSAAMVAPEVSSLGLGSHS